MSRLKLDLPCWACGAYQPRERSCSECDAPPWARAVDPGGVYIPAALSAGLPNHTEWFWPTPALDRLSSSVEFMREGVAWEEAHDLDFEPRPWEPVL